MLVYFRNIITDNIIGLVVECSSIVWETGVKSQVESFQRLKRWYLMPSCLTLSLIRYVSRGKWTNPGKGIAPFLTPWYSSSRKENLRVTLDYVFYDYHRLSINYTLFNTYIYIYIYTHTHIHTHIYIYIYGLFSFLWYMNIRGLSKAKAIIEQKRYYLTDSWREMEVHAFQKDIDPIVNIRV